MRETPPIATHQRLTDSKGHIRSFREEDIPEVARLHRAVFKLDDSVTLGAYRAYFMRVFLDGAASDGPPSSLVFEEDDGQVTGFLGLVPRRVTVDGHRFQALVSSQFIVSPASRVGLVALRLAKAYLDGPQDVSIADEANDVSQKIWEGLGGTTARLLSLYWTRPLRPARLAASFLRQRRGFTSVAAAAGPLATAADALVTRLPGSYFRQVEPRAGLEATCGPSAVAHLTALSDRSSLRVEHDDRTLQWLVDRVASRRPGGRLLAATLRKGRTTLGGYIGCLGGDGVADVGQLVATTGSVHDVLDRLFYDAWCQGALAVTGRLEPRFMQALSDKYCLFHRRGPWVLVKTTKPEILQAFQSGDAQFSRLDGEWGLRL